jgi:hypothetical protein
VSEGYTDAIVQLLADEWGSIPELVALTRADVSFGSFVIRHVDASASEPDLRALLRNAAVCTAAPADLCAALVTSAQRALAEQ